MKRFMERFAALARSTSFLCSRSDTLTVMACVFKEIPPCGASIEPGSILSIKSLGEGR